ncbi:hypothetical protein [Metabacillus endolithicus]|uniref:hypothetical protein n=1 Tax=Metabacillus endolithicus TaxID=1535204 RepID=UPI001FF72A7A|nr:hypothetical protein [Metabacillus endolithicus]UPG64570.1 hypothetical protein MVE64_05710 [Metabacillus endolithicus]
MADENKFNERDRFDNPDYKGITPLDRELENYETESAAEIAANQYGSYKRYC